MILTEVLTYATTFPSVIHCNTTYISSIFIHVVRNPLVALVCIDHRNYALGNLNGPIV